MTSRLLTLIAVVCSILLAAASRAQDASAPLRQAIIAFMKGYLSTHLTGLSSLPAFEIFFYNRSGPLKKTFQAHPRLAIHTGMFASGNSTYDVTPLHGATVPVLYVLCVAVALSNPKHYLNCGPEKEYVLHA